MVPQTARILSAPTHEPRPPTPPRESEARSLSFDHSFRREITSQASNVTPDSSAESPATATYRKRVNWASNGETISSPITQPLQTSREPKTLKSILKPYNGVNVRGKISPPHSYANLSAMLESITQQLGGDDRDSKMDAYTTLSGSIKACDNVPELRALKEKMGLLLQFMRRDLTAKNPAGGWDTPLIVNDLILLSSFLHKSCIAELLSNDFSTYLVDHAIKTFEVPGMSKDVVKHLMFILAQQNFSPKIMNETRVTRLIAALHDIGKFVNGKSIITGRLDIYKNLIRNSRSSMLANTDWFDDLFSDMLSGQKTTRTSAIELGIDSGLVLGTEAKASRVIMELFTRGDNKDPPVPKFGEIFSDQLREAIRKKKDESANVPQIWSVPVLFLRCKPRQFEHWAFMNQWFKVLQECFNTSDQPTKLEANLAWNRLVFTVRPDEKTSQALVPLLCRPLLEQFKRKSKGKLRKSTLSSICVLLYYSLRPNASAQQLELYWKEYVAQILGYALTAAVVVDTPDSARQDLSDACRILRTLFDSTTPRPWKENRVMELNSPEAIMEPSELPALESKWLRKSAQQVFSVLDPLLEKLYWDLSDDSEIITNLWKSYIISIAAPAVKEVKVSSETMACIASIFNLLYRIWHIGPKNVRSLAPSNGSGSGSTNFLKSFEKIISTTIEGLSLLPFTEKLLSIGSQDTFIVIATPSHGSRNTRGETRCPLHHLFILLTRMCPGLHYDSKFSLLVRQVLAPFFGARASGRAKMELVKDLLQLLPAESTVSGRLMWQVLADFAALAADERDANCLANGGISDQPLGMDYRSALKILEVGIDMSPEEPLPGWQKVFEVLINSSSLDAGDSGRAIAVIEPLARAFATKFSSDNIRSILGLSYCRLLTSKATYPKDRQALDAARRRLWGTVNLGAKGTPSDPYVQLYEYLRSCLETSYASFTKEQVFHYADVLAATTGLLTRCPDVILFNLLLKLQKGIGCWIHDDQSKLGGGNPLSQAVIAIWGKICNDLPHIKQFYSHTMIL